MADKKPVKDDAKKDASKKDAPKKGGCGCGCGNKK